MKSDEKVTSQNITLVKWRDDAASIWYENDSQTAIYTH